MIMSLAKIFMIVTTWKSKFVIIWSKTGYTAKLWIIFNLHAKNKRE